MTIKYLEKIFNISVSEMKRIIKDFQSEMARGLVGKKSSLKMIPTYVDRPTGDEKGNFLAIDLGGTNLRILELELKGRGESAITAVKKSVIDKKHLKGSGEEFFGFIAGCIKAFLEDENIGIGEVRRGIGFTFSFPVNQTGIASGTLVRWTKGFNVKGVIGKDVVKLLNEALARKGLYNLKIGALANDTVGTLVTRGYEDPACDVGVIIGTGTNACYIEELSKMPKWRGPVTESGRMIINIEWGNFNKFPLTPYDKELDRVSDIPGEQILEKMISGIYLGELTRLALKDLVARKMFFKDMAPSAFSQKDGFKTEYISLVEGDSSSDLSKIDRLLKDLGLKESTLADRRLIKRICRLISLRASRISAASIAAVITKMDFKLSRKHTVAIDGSVYAEHPNFSKNMKYALKKLFGEKASRIKLVLTKDGSGKGAAILAAIAGGGL